MSGATGAGGATGGLPGGTPYGGVPPRPTEHPAAASTSLMPPVGAAGQAGTAGYGGQPAAAPQGGAAADGFSTPTTYAKGQPTPARGTRVPPGAARRPGTPPAAQGGIRTRKARLRITKADPWSVMKVSFLLSLAVGVIMIVAAAVLWMTLDGLGVFDSLSSTLSDVTGNDSASSFNLMDYIGFGRVMMFTILISVVDVVLMTALATLSAFIYNTAAGFTGGIELTLAEED
ncbi:DUF3566 domain-containing protein [Kitasatospora sp. MBT63]|uniref:DUF3566 domain-containing protein n=1 Tax=Kitasatospora sp. MBT63 TaxID=1444768 RepID=UPI000AA0A97F|nr:DUF3566 domain-containing protein [Kitasatospora sp. MBT63]